MNNLIPTGRPPINLPVMVGTRNHPKNGKNSCICIELLAPEQTNHEALVNGLRRILPFIYRKYEDVVSILLRHGMDFADRIPLPTSFDYQWAHTGEILMCAYFEECEKKVVLTYKWRLNTSNNQNQLGMDLMAFDFAKTPPEIYLIAVKTSGEGADKKTPSVIYSARTELKNYLEVDTLHDDLEIISANLQTNDQCRQTFLSWYDPYSQGVAAATPVLVSTPAIVIEKNVWDDRYAEPLINFDFGTLGTIRIFTVFELEKLVQQVYAGNAT